MLDKMTDKEGAPHAQANPSATPTKDSSGLPGCLPKMTRSRLSLLLALALGWNHGQCVSNAELEAEKAALTAKLDLAQAQLGASQSEIHRLRGEVMVGARRGQENIGSIISITRALLVCQDDLASLNRTLGYYERALEECHYDSDPMDDLGDWDPSDEEGYLSPDSGPGVTIPDTDPNLSPQPEENGGGSEKDYPVFPLPPTPPIVPERNRIVNPAGKGVFLARGLE